MNRRSFIGSIIGTAFGAGFLGMLPKDKPQKIILPYKLTFTEANGEEMQAPATVDIVCEKETIRVLAGDFLPNSTMSVTGAKLYTINNEFMGEGKFSSPVGLVPGDTLKATYSLWIDSGDPTLLSDSVRPDYERILEAIKTRNFDAFNELWFKHRYKSNRFKRSNYAE